MVIVCALTMAAVAAVMGRAVVTISRHRAERAADLSALAAAAHPSKGPDRACDVAERVAHDNGARLVACRFDVPFVAEVTVDVRQPMRWLPGPVRASARAGPLDDAAPER